MQITYVYSHSISLVMGMARIRSCANGWFTLTRKFTYKEMSPPIIFARRDRPMNALGLQLCRRQYSHKETLQQTFCKQSAILDAKRLFCVFEPLRLIGNIWCSSMAHWKACSRLPISVNSTFFARCYGWGTTRDYRLNIGVFAPSQFDPKFQVEGVAPHQPFFLSQN